jgi:hypothetical protein
MNDTSTRRCLLRACSAAGPFALAGCFGADDGESDDDTDDASDASDDTDDEEGDGSDDSGVPPPRRLDGRAAGNCLRQPGTNTSSRSRLRASTSTSVTPIRGPGWSGT